MKWSFSRTRRAIRRGNAARDLRDWQTALLCYRKALTLDPGLQRIWVQYGHCHKELGRLDDAEVFYRKALHLDPQSADTWLQLGHVLKLKGERTQAADAYASGAALDPGNLHIARELSAIAPPGPAPSFGTVIIGTMGLCNASCIHCPTGKAETAHVPRTPMTMAMFESLIGQIADTGWPIRGQISFGLFGDGLLDPHVVERARLVRERLPHAWLSVNTNGAAYNPQRHHALKDYASILAVHIESLDPQVYAHLMAPLRLERVLPKIEQILADFPGKVDISIPTSRLNKDELPALKEYFLARGALNVRSDPLSARCGQDHTLFNELALKSEPGSCRADVLDDLIVDCDGRVLICCNDFGREEPVGELAADSLAAVLAGARRRQIAKTLDAGAWREMKTCSKCAYSPGFG